MPRTNVTEDLTIAALANEACPSPFHFVRAFKVATGVAPHRYLMNRRLEKDRSWISAGQLPLAESFGTASPPRPRSSKWFKRLVGTTPGEYLACCA